jgi:hypothetical protein
MKKIALFSFLIFLCTVIASFISPPLGTLNSDAKIDDNTYIAMTDGEIIEKALRTNYNTFENFSARYKNTVLSWFGQSRNIDENYISQEIVDEYRKFEDYFINFGRILPYLFIFISLSLMFIRKKQT